MTFRHIYLESLYLYLIFISFSESKTEKSNGQHFNGRYTQGIKDFELVIPRKINEDGRFLSFSIPHSYLMRNKRRKRERVDDTVRYALEFGGKEHNVVLEPNHDFISTSFVIETHHGPDLNKDINLRKRREAQCHYTGFVQGDSESRVALSVCEGLAGLIKTTLGSFFIEPAKYSVPEKDGKHLHMIYQNNSEPKTKHTIDDDSKSCDFADNLKNKYSNQSLQFTPVKRSMKPKHHYMATLVVADKKFLAHHNGTDVETYILTIMNMVSDYFHDESIGQLIDVVIVRMILLESEHKDIDIEVSRSANKTLKSFCNWQKKINPPDPLHPNHHDVAVLLTRQDLCSEKTDSGNGNLEKINSCSIQGLANSVSICNSNKSCTVNEDNGLVLSVVVTHELGHLLGCPHDQKEVNSCSPTAPDGSNHVMAPGIRFHTTDWSNCSSGAVAELFDAGLGDCLLNAPVDHSFPLSEMLAGAMYDADYQCRLAFGTGAEPCHVQGDMFCATLLCRPRGKAACYSRGEPAADGTTCGSNKWCYDRKCVEAGRRPGAVDGGWGEWSPWSSCSRTCGGGVSYQERNCDRPVPRERGRYCLGERKQYQTCNTATCNATTTYRDRQCAQFNSKTFNGARHQWVSHRPRGPHDRCALLCINEAGRHKTLRPRVADGTPCRAGKRDMCVGGRCTEIGCDWQIESGAIVDRCGVCRGDGTQCRVVAGTFRSNETSDSTSPVRGSPLKTWLITRVPRGARNVRLSLAKSTPRVTIAVASEDGRKYYLNGGASDNADGEFAVGTMRGVYSHPEPYRGEVVIAGPTPLSLSLRLVSGGGRFHHARASYSFAIAAANATYLPRFTWEFLGWGSCSVRCGGGSRMAQARCVETEAGEVSRSFCQTLERPTPKTQTCSTEPCPVRWVSEPWGPCDAFGSQRRVVACRRQAARSDRDDVEESEAACHGAKKPARVRPCKAKAKDKRQRRRVRTEDFTQHRKSNDFSNVSINPLEELSFFPHSRHIERSPKGEVSKPLFRGPNHRHHKSTTSRPPTTTTTVTTTTVTTAAPSDTRPLCGRKLIAALNCSQFGFDDDVFGLKTCPHASKVKRDEEPEEIPVEPKAAMKKVEKETITSEDEETKPKEPKEKEVKETEGILEKEAEKDKTEKKPKGFAKLKKMLPAFGTKKNKTEPIDTVSKDNTSLAKVPTKSMLTRLPTLPRLTLQKKQKGVMVEESGQAAANGESEPSMCANLTASVLVEDHVSAEDLVLIEAPVSLVKASGSSPKVGESGATYKLSDEGEEEMGDQIPEEQVDTRHKKVYHGDEALKISKELESGKHKG